MDVAEWSKIITAFLACAYRPSLIGLPTEMFAFHFPFFKILIISVAASVSSSFVSAFLSEELILGYAWVMRKLFPNRPKKKRMTKMNRFLIKAKWYFGIVGVSAIAPLVLSIPFGTFIAIRFFGYRNRAKTVLYMSLSAIAWTVILYFIYHKFHTYFINYFK